MLVADLPGLVHVIDLGVLLDRIRHLERIVGHEIGHASSSTTRSGGRNSWCCTNAWRVASTSRVQPRSTSSTAQPSDLNTIERGKRIAAHIGIDLHIAEIDRIGDLPAFDAILRAPARRTRVAQGIMIEFGCGPAVTICISAASPTVRVIGPQ